MGRSLELGLPPLSITVEDIGQKVKSGLAKLAMQEGHPDTPSSRGTHSNGGLNCGSIGSWHCSGIGGWHHSKIGGQASFGGPV